MSSGEKKDEDAKKEGFLKKMFGTSGKSSSSDKSKKHTRPGKTSKHSIGDDGQKAHMHDAGPDEGHGGKDPDPDQIIRDSNDACK